MLDEAKKMLKALKDGARIAEAEAEAEISEMVRQLTERAKEIEHDSEASHLDALENKECWKLAEELEEFI